MALDLTKETKVSLAAKLEQALLERDNANIAANKLAKIATDFGTTLSGIETLLKDAPFIQKGFFKKLWWVISNWKQLAALLEDILNHISDWRKYMDNLIEQSKGVTPDPKSTIVV